MRQVYTVHVNNVAVYHGVNAQDALEHTIAACGNEGNDVRVRETETIDMAEAQELFAAAQVAQTAFWEAMRALERCIGGEIDSNDDLNDTNLAMVIENKGAKV